MSKHNDVKEGGSVKPYVIIKGGFSWSLQSPQRGGGGVKIRKIALRNLWTAPYYVLCDVTENALDSRIFLLCTVGSIVYLHLYL